ncbi:alpha/beta hydrolase [Virgibacillus profundi]|uniref:Alpha/beta hydrolase n=2 Tax=Virgibacillus profundi TaxID=2024555 RepID=A0A2A2IFF8_9BACI|nr:alpha/beta hydrolase [Virgibacillus profundi]PXY54903.1 alpha/beta hydrolase [Virgibacillus profundi]
MSILIVFIILTGCNNDNKEDESSKGDDSIMESLTGFWSGAIEIPNQPLDIQVDFENKDELTGELSIPIQGVQNYPLSTIKMEDMNIVFTMEIQGQYITFDGNLEDEKITGTFKQNGQSFPFELAKGEAVVGNDEEDGEFLQIETDHGTLHGELETPDGEGSFTVMIIIPGSGPTDRNGNSPGIQNNSLKLLAEQLAEQGIATVRYDKRGAGKNIQSAIPEQEMTFDQMVNDATSWVELLEKDENYSQVGIIGHSQGSLVGMLAARESNVSSFISLAGAGQPIDKVLENQLSEQLSDELLKESKEILQQLKEGKHVENISQELQSVFRPSVQSFLSSWMQYDPAEEIQKLEVPTLIVNGENDLQVPVSEAKLLHEAKSDAELMLIEKMNHVLKEAPADREGNMQTYSNPDLPLADGLINGIVEFLE